MPRPHGPALLPSTRRRLSATGIVVMLLAGCARHPAPAVEPESPARRLTSELTRIFLAPAFDHALFAAKIQSLASGEVLYELNPHKLMMPASNMKIVTLAVAASQLGWDHRFETRLVSSAPIDSGVLNGDLVVVGTGDPTIGAETSDHAGVFREWANGLKQAGVTTIAGRIIGNDDTFDDEGFGAAWSWDDLPYGYAAPSGALQYHQGSVDFTIAPGAAVGDDAEVRLEPTESGLQILSRVRTAEAGSQVTLDLKRLPRQPTLELDGSVPIDAGPLTRTASVDNPTAFFVRALRAGLLANGLDVRGPAVDIDDLGERDTSTLATNGPPTEPRVLFRHLSPTLAEIGTVLMKESQNLYAETFLKTIGYARTGRGTAEAGRQIADTVLESWGIPLTEYRMYDGSGLSRNNYLTADMLVRILREMHRSSGFDQFLATLPIGGTDGTLEGRMKTTRAEGNVRAKTGSIANVRSLSGYVTTLDGELLVFSILANHFSLPPSTTLAQIDLAVERLANFTRK